MEAWRRREDFRTEAAARRLTRSSHRLNVRVPVRWSPHLRMMDEVARNAWNDLPASIREQENEREAKIVIKKFVLVEQLSVVIVFVLLNVVSITYTFLSEPAVFSKAVFHGSNFYSSFAKSIFTLFRLCHHAQNQHRKRKITRKTEI